MATQYFPALPVLNFGKQQHNQSDADHDDSESARRQKSLRQISVCLVQILKEFVHAETKRDQRQRHLNPCCQITFVGESQVFDGDPGRG